MFLSQVRSGSVRMSLFVSVYIKIVLIHFYTVLYWNIDMEAVLYWKRLKG
jgi:hypothetical protein